MNIYDFLDQVAANNNRPWFAAHRSEFDVLRLEWLDQLQRLINSMSLWEPAMAAIDAKEASYRFYRDTRFSLDKSPYKTFFSALLSPWGRKTKLASWYVQIDSRNEENGLYCGLWMPDSAMLNKMRHAIVDNIEEWEEILSNPIFCKSWPHWANISPLLKTAPAGWAKDHPQIQYLRMRDYGKYRSCSRKFFLDPSWPEATAEIMSSAKPFIDFINYSLTEE